MNKLIVSSSPHISSPATTTRIMLDVLIAMLPAIIMSYVHFGLRALLLILVCAASCVAAEAIYCLLLKKPVPVGDLSAAVTGVMLAFNLPSSLPFWQAIVGSVVAIVVVKQLFGGLGCNFVNPALASRVILAVSFPSAMTHYTYPAAAADALSSATPLALIASGQGKSINLMDLLIGNHGSVLGETCCAALLLGGLYLILRRVIKPIIPLAYIGSAFVFLWAFGCDVPLASIMSGGLFLGAFFMATDYVTSPYTNKGKLIFGLGCGLITATIRTFANSAGGVAYSILLMNLLVPYINDLCRKKPYGTEVDA